MSEALRSRRNIHVVRSADEPALAPHIKPLAQLRRMFSYVRPYSNRLMGAMVCLAVASSLGLAYPYYLGVLAEIAFDNAATAHPEAAHRELGATTLWLLGLFLAQACFVSLHHYFMTWLGERVIADVRKALYRHITGLSPGYFHSTRTGELLSRFTDDVARLQRTVSQDLSITLRSVFVLTGGVSILFYINSKLTAVMLAVVPVLMIAATCWGRVIRELSRKAQDGLATANGSLQEGLAAIETVQAFGREDFEAGRYDSAVELTFALFIRRAVSSSWFAAVVGFISFATITGVFWLGGSMAIQGTLTAAGLTSFIFYTLLVAGAVGALADLFEVLQSSIGATQRIFEIFDTTSEIVDPLSPVPEPTLRGEIEFVGVTFSYGDRQVDVVRNINLRICAGEICALVGSSGSGKTTLGRLVLRYWDPTQGKILFDGHDLRGLRLADLREAMAVVSQDPVLFSGSIRENIRYGRLSASDAEVEAVARAANADSFIRDFPAGYDTMVGERGVRLSGGQRQRVSIARALLRDPKVLILDEATSALDSESEHLVQEALEVLQRGRTTLVIAHRLSTIQHADRIAVLHHGEIVEAGQHGELMARGGHYTRLVVRQAFVADRSSLETPP